MKKSLIYSISLIVLFLGVIYCLNTSYSYSSDDCTYALKSNTTGGWALVDSGTLCESPDNLSRLCSLREVWDANISDGYRPIVHFFVRAFTGWLGKEVFNIANTFIMGCFLLLLYRFSTSSWSLKFSTTTFAITLIFLFLCKGESYLWCAGSINYLWAATGALLFCLIRDYVQKEHVSIPLLIVINMIVVIVGWAQEAFSLPICFALGCWGLLNLKRLNWREISLYCCYGIGTLFLCWVAGRRASSIETFTVSGLIMTWLKCALACKVVWIMMCYFLFVKEKKAFIRRNLFELFVILGSLLLISIVGFNGERSLFAANLFAIIILLREIKFPLSCTIPCVCMLVVLWGVVLTLGKEIKQNFDTFTTLYLSSTDYVTVHERVQCNIFARFFHQSIYTWQTSGHSQSYAAYYGRNIAPIALSGHLYTSLYLNNTFFTSENRLPIEGVYYTTNEENLIVTPLTSDVDLNREIHAYVKYKFPNDFKFRIWKELAIRRNPPVPFPTKTRVLKTKHGNYLLLAKIPYCDQYIQSVRLE